jgi:ABC-2 type transport system permease protein
VIYKKELTAFFNHLTGYLVLGVFLTVMGLFLFVFPETSLLESNIATMEPFFEMAPSLFLFLVPAITMRLLAEERQLGTLALLLTKPIDELGLVVGKFLAALTLLILALLPTLFYYLTLYVLSSPVGNLDSGAIVGSYVGLFLLGGSFSAIGILASSLTESQIVAFVFAVTGCFLFFYGFYFLSALPVFFGKWDALVQQLGMDYHYHALSKGAPDTRDLIYFLSVITIFLSITRFVLQYRIRS